MGNWATKKKKEKSKMYRLKRTNTEIDDLLNTANRWEELGGSSVPGMSYEQGVKAAIDWVLGDCDDLPINVESD